MNEKIFKNRTEAGRELALKLLPHMNNHPLIIALPRGGVPVAYEVAYVLNSPLDTVVARKIGAPQNREFGVGAIAPGNTIILDDESMKHLGLESHDLEQIIEEEKIEMERRITRYKSGGYSKNIIADTVIIVDDGLATGVTARAAIESVKKFLSPDKIIFAAPICAGDTAMQLRNLVDEVICVREADNLIAIGYWYEEFEQTTDEEVINYLKKANNK